MLRDRALGVVACGWLAAGTAAAQDHVDLEVGESVTLRMNTVSGGIFCPHDSHQPSCVVTASPPGADPDIYAVQYPDCVTPLLSSGVSYHEVRFEAYDPSQVGRWRVECEAWERPRATCYSTVSECGFRCASHDDVDRRVAAWIIDVLPDAPTLSVSGDMHVWKNERIQLTATPYDSRFEYQWNVQRPDMSGWLYDVDAGSAFDQLADAVGTWRIAVNALRDGDIRSSAYVDVQVYNQRPSFSLIGATAIDVGANLVVENTTLEDPDGGAPLTFRWEAVQAPTSALVQLDAAVLDQARLDIPTNTASAGTWSFVLNMCDDEGECQQSERWSVHVDGPPSAEIVAADVVLPFDFPVLLDGTGSADSDADCTAGTSCHHWVASGWGLAGVDPTLSYRWYIDSVPAEHADRYAIGAVSAAFHVPDTGAELAFEYDDILPGHYRFRLLVEDGEGNVDEAWHDLEVRPLDAAPVANLSPPRRYLTDVDGLLTEPIVVDGARSFDPDDVLGPSPSADAGIDAFAWDLTPPSAGCPRPTFGNTSSIRVFDAGDSVPPACLGTWTVRLTVTDTDGDTGTADTRFIIGNCAGDVCIDYPTGMNRAEIGVGSAVDVQVYYHIDPAVYDAFPYGFSTQLDILPSTGGSAVYSVYDPSAAASGPGSILTFYWDGTANVGPGAGGRVPTAQYDVRITILDWSGSPTTLADYEPLAISYERAEMTIVSADEFVSRAAMREVADRLNFEATLSGSLGVDTWRWTITAPSGAVATRRVVSATSDTLIEHWDGYSGTQLQPPGLYTLEVQAFRGSWLLASAVATSTLYEIRMAPVAGSDERVRVVANLDDDDGDRLPDTLDANIAGEDDLVQIAVTMEPMVAGTASLSPSAGVALHDDAVKASPCASPCELVAADTPLDAVVFVEGVTPDEGYVELRFVTAEGVALPVETLPIDVVHLEIIDAYGFPASYVRVGMWDDPDAYGPDDLLRNEADPAQNFVDIDRHRFFVRLTDPQGNANPEAIDLVVARLGTVFEYPYAGSPDYTDDQTEIYLFETDLDTGVFESETQLLTSNDDPTLIANGDDLFPVTNLDFTSAIDDTPGDRSHQVGRDGYGYLTGGVEVVLGSGDPGDPELRTGAPVCRRGEYDERRFVPVEAVVFREPFEDADGGTPDAFDFSDADGDGVHDPDEPSERYMDLSHDPSGRWVQGGGAMPPADGRGPVATTEYVTEQVRKANLAWAPACIELRLGSVVVSDAPPATGEPSVVRIRTDGLADDADPVLAAYMSERMDVLNVVVPGPNLELLMDTVGGVEMYASLAGYAFIPLSGRTWGQTIVYLASSRPLEERVLAHEAGHALTNGVDVLGPPRFFFPSLGGPPDGDLTVDQYRRFPPGTWAAARTKYTGPTNIGRREPGSRLLHDFVAP